MQLSVIAIFCLTAIASQATREASEDIFELINAGDTAALVDLLLNDPSQVNAEDEDTGMLPLCEAAWLGDLEVSMLLLAHGADIEQASQGQTPLMWAAKMDHPDLARAFLKEGAEVNHIDDDWTALRFGVWSGNTEVVELLLHAGADPTLPLSDNVEPLMNLGAENGTSELIEILIANGVSFAKVSPYTGNSPLHIAALRGNLEAITTLLGGGAPIQDLGELGRSPLHLACSGGHFNVVKFLVREGANVVAQDDLGGTAMHIAAQEGHTRILGELMFSGWPMPDMSVRDNRGWTPLHEASAFGSLRCASYLSSMTPEKVDAVTDFQRTPLHLAALAGNVEMIELLVERGADPLIEDANGETGLDYLERVVFPRLKAKLLGGKDKENQVSSLELPQWDGRDPIVSQYRSGGYSVKPTSGLQLGIWADGVVVFASNPMEPGETMRVGMIPPGRAKRLVDSLADIGFASTPKGRYVGMHSSSERISLEVGDKRLAHEWDGGIHPQSGFYNPSSSKRSFVRMWQLAELVLRGYLPTESVPFDQVMADGSFRGYPTAEGRPPEWSR